MMMLLLFFAQFIAQNVKTQVIIRKNPHILWDLVCELFLCKIEIKDQNKMCNQRNLTWWMVRWTMLPFYHQRSSKDLE
jgi:hypothetical protein